MIELSKTGNIIFPEDLPKFEITNGEVTIDGKQLESVTEFALTSGKFCTADLVIKMVVRL